MWLHQISNHIIPRIILKTQYNFFIKKNKNFLHTSDTSLFTRVPVNFKIPTHAKHTAVFLSHSVAPTTSPASSYDITFKFAKTSFKFRSTINCSSISFIFI